MRTKTIKHIQKLSNSFTLHDIPKTDDHFKYEMVRSNSQTYEPLVVNAKILTIVDKNGNIVTDSDVKKRGLMVSLILNKTCFYCKAGGQQNDIGIVKTKNGKIFDVISVEKIQENGIILHNINSEDWPILLKYLS